jgi:hypothetical protein
MRYRSWLEASCDRSSPSRLRQTRLELEDLEKRELMTASPLTLTGPVDTYHSANAVVPATTDTNRATVVFQPNAAAQQPTAQPQPVVISIIAILIG